MSELLQIEFIDDNFTVDRSEEYQLLINQDKSTFQMAILDDQHQLLLLLSWQKDSAEDRVVQLLNRPYKSKKIVLNNKNILLLPSDLYDSNQEINYLNLLYINQHTNHLLTDHLPSFSAYLLYGISTTERQTISAKFSDTQPYARNTTLLLAVKHLLTEQDTFFALNFNGDYTDFTYFSGGSLKYHHSLPTQNADEFNYFLLAVSKEHQIDLSQTPLYLSGKINEEHAYYHRLAKYNSQLHFIDLAGFIKCSNYKIQQKAYTRLSLFGLLCV